MRSNVIASFSLIMIIAVGSGCSTPLSKREQGDLSAAVSALELAQLSVAPSDMRPSVRS